jgi:hypothetical protein
MSGTLDHVLRKLKSKLCNGQYMHNAHVRLIFALVQQKYEFRAVNEEMSRRCRTPFGARVAPVKFLR